MAFKIYTKTGDEGLTGLIGGTRIPKFDIRIEAYGTVDELNSWMGILRDTETNETSIKSILEIQERLFTLGSHLAADPEKNKMKLPELFEDDITFLENEIDKMDEQLEPMKFFVLPGGHVRVSNAHVARCVCRRAERLVVHLASETKIDEKIQKYLNRLSDYLFTYSRFISKEVKANEIAWKPREK